MELEALTCHCLKCHDGDRAASISIRSHTPPGGHGSRSNTHTVIQITEIRISISNTRTTYVTHRTISTNNQESSHAPHDHDSFTAQSRDTTTIHRTAQSPHNHAHNHRTRPQDKHMGHGIATLQRHAHEVFTYHTTTNFTRAHTHRAHSTSQEDTLHSQSGSRRPSRRSRGSMRPSSHLSMASGVAHLAIASGHPQGRARFWWDSDAVCPEGESGYNARAGPRPDAVLLRGLEGRNGRQAAAAAAAEV